MIKQEKLETKGTLPAEARPAPMATMLASAMPQEKNRSGNSFANSEVKVDLERSASQTTTLGSALPTSTSTLPNASRVAMPVFSSNLVRIAILIQLLQCALYLVGGRGDAVKLGIVFHERHTLAFHGVGYDRRRLPLHSFDLGKRRFQSRDVVAIQFYGMPP